MEVLSDIFKSIFATIAAGGPSAVIGLLILVLLGAFYVANYVIKLFLMFAKERIKLCEQIIADKDKQIAALSKSMQEMATSNAESNNKIVATLTSIQLVLTELKTRMEFINVASGSNKWRQPPSSL